MSRAAAPPLSLLPLLLLLLLLLRVAAAQLDGGSASSEGAAGGSDEAEFREPGDGRDSVDLIDLTTTTVAAFNYMIIANKKLQLGVQYTIGVATRGGDGIKTVTAAISTQSKGDEFEDISVTGSRAFAAAGTQWTQLVLNVDYDASTPSRYDTNGKYQLEVTIEDFSGSTFSNKTAILVRKPRAKTLVQTDKAVYQPGQTVKYRVVTIDRGFTPVQEDVEVTIRDARNNLVYKRTHSVDDDSQEGNGTVSQGELPLSVLPNEGTWTLYAVTASYGRQSKSFEVTTYTLPRFQLEVTGPDFVHFNDSSFSVKAAVRYTYDKAVEGSFKVKLGPYNPCRSCKPRYDLQQEFNVEAETGENVFTFDMEAWRRHLLGVEGWTASRYSYSAKARVEFVEKFTGVNKSATVDITIYTRKYDMQISTNASFFLPGFKIPLSVKLQRPNRKLVTEEVSETVSVTMQYKRRGKPNSAEVYNGDVYAAETGTGVSLLAEVPSDADFSPITFEAKLDEQDAQDSTRLLPYVAVTDEFVTAEFETLEGSTQLLLKKSDGVLLTYLAVVSRNQLQSWKQVTMAENELRMDFTDDSGLKCRKLLPQAHVLLLGVTASGEVVAAADSVDLRSFLGNVTLSTNLTSDTGLPKEFASVRVQATPNSFVFLTGIDHSVNLIRTGQDILRDSLTIETTTRYSRWGPRPSGTDTAKLLRGKDLILLSDAFYYDGANSGGGALYRPRTELASPGLAADNARGAGVRGGRGGGGGGGGGGESETQVRDFFPETLLWSTVWVNSSGAGEQTVQLADTMTSWDVSAWGVAPGRPLLTMSAPMRMVTRQSFFLQPLLPVSVVRGERFVLKVATFNYAGAAGGVNVSLRVDAGAGFSATPLGGGDTWRSDNEVGVAISADAGDGNGGAGLATFEVSPTSLEPMSLRLRGDLRVERSDNASVEVFSDIVERPLTVLPEGETVRRTKAVLLQVSDDSESSGNVSVEFPAEGGRLVAGSEVLTYSVLGDVLGPAMDNLERLVRVPSGCGEQNLVNFAPAVGVARYLRSVYGDSPSADAATKLAKAVNAASVGYQRQLTYRRSSDGAFSAFGDSDPAGSTWLTAAVLREFARADDFVAVEASAIGGRSLKFVLEQQTVDGAFAEPPGGRVFDARLQGGAASSSVAMTASVCSSLLDVGAAASSRPDLRATMRKLGVDLRGGVEKCVRRLASRRQDDVERMDALDLALSAYTLQLAEANGFLEAGDAGGRLTAARRRLREALEAKATKSNGRKYWRTPTRYGSVRDSVEASAYALMLSVLADAQPDVGVLRWLVDQQNDNGGFSDTQETIVGLRALTEVAVKMDADGAATTEATVTVSAGGADEGRRSFGINADNRFVLRTNFVGRGAEARAASQLTAAATGSGLLLLSAAWQYNLMPEERLRLGTASWTNASGLALRLQELKVVPDSVGGVAFGVCAAANLSDGMYILTVANPSGFAPSAHTLPSERRGLRRVEATAGGGVVFYFDSLPAGVCVEAKWRREVAVLDSAPQQVTLRKYYSAENSLTVFYSPPELRGVTACDACPDCPGCSTSALSSEEAMSEGAWGRVLRKLF